MRKVKGLFRLLRIELPFAAGVCAVMGQVLALGAFAPGRETTLAFLSLFFVSASILVLNDYIDVETDRINAPARPIPSGLVKPSEALVLSGVLSLTGVLLGFLLGPSAFIVVIVLLVIGVSYDSHFKKSGLPGNLMVSFSVGMTFVYGGISVGLPCSPGVLFFAVIAVLIDLGEEVASDAMDMKGDAAAGSKSLAIRCGRQVALRISGGIFSIVIILSVIPFLLRWFSPAYLIPIALMDITIAISTVGLLASDDTSGRKHIRRLYLGATAGLMLFLLMRLFEI
jgi:geranylgeranylglycerol-phosphate geranylgeranyltransferase